MNFKSLFAFKKQPTIIQNMDEKTMEDMPYIKIPLRGKYGKGKHVLVDGDYDGEYFGQYGWYINPGGYVYRRRYTGEGGGYIYLHQEVSQTPKGMWTNFKDKNKLNCRSYNLEWVTPSQSAQMRRPRSLKQK
jgi:hypothetical protein